MRSRLYLIPLIIIGFCSFSKAQQVQITSPLPLPVSGSFTAKASTFTTNVVSTYTVISSTYPIAVSGSFSFTPPALTTVTFNGVSQPVTATFIPPALTTVTTNGSAIPVTSTYTTVVSTGLPVTGTFWQATQPISGNVTVIQSTVGINGTVPVSGTFWQATQPITHNGIGQPVTSTYTTVVSTGLPVTGTFWQTTQPISGNVSVVQSTVGVVTTGIGLNVISTNTQVTQSTVGVVNGGQTFNVTVNAALPTGTNSIGKINFSTPTTTVFSSTTINTTSTGDNTIVAAVGGQTVRVFQMFFVVGAATNITIKDGTGVNLTGPMNMTANGSFILDFSGDPWFVTTSGNGFVINQSGTAQISGRIYFSQS